MFNQIRLSLISVIVLTGFSSIASADSIAYKDLKVISDPLPIMSVDVVKVGPDKAEQLNPTTIELKVSTSGSCGATIGIERLSKNRFKFSELGSTRIGAETGCDNDIQYFWTPSDLSIPMDSPTPVTLEIARGRPDYPSSEPKTYITVQAMVTHKRGKMGHYFEYSDVHVVLQNQ